MIAVIASSSSRAGRMIVALAAGGILLLNGRWVDKMLNHIDWQLLLLFVGLFVNGAFSQTGLPARAVHELAKLRWISTTWPCSSA